MCRGAVREKRLCMSSETAWRVSMRCSASPCPRCSQSVLKVRHSPSRPFPSSRQTTAKATRSIRTACALSTPSMGCKSSSSAAGNPSSARSASARRSCRLSSLMTDKPGSMFRMHSVRDEEMSALGLRVRPRRICSAWIPARVGSSFSFSVIAPRRKII